MTKRKPGSTTPPRVRWTDEQVELLKREYPDQLAEDLADRLGCDVKRVYAKASALGLQKSEAFRRSEQSGRIKRGRDDPRMVATQFKPGQNTWNKGVKGICGTHPNSRRTQFKADGSLRGAAQHNYVPIGTERVSKDGYLERKTNDDHPAVRRWVGVHRLVWEAANGPIPAGYVVCFLPGRRTAVAATITLDCLELISRAELARRNHPVTRSPELAKLVQLKGAITRQINRIAREAKEKQS